DANYAKTSSYDADGKMHWQEANNWAAGLNFGGFDDWRLATVVDQVDGGAEVGCDYSVDGSDCGYNVDTAGSEMAYMWYNILSGTPSYDTNGVWEPDSGFTGAIGADGVEIFNLQGDTDNNGSDFYWTGTSIPRWNDCCAFTFHAGWGLQNYDDKDGSDQEYFAWAVRSGDVAAVPIPGTVWLFSSGLMGLLGYSRRKQAISA
ncbi:MAG: hypothetical protein KAI17_05080, partial [Thiotrichaceae bacterium]|nr:hypothetical protein [Thiotrichaceae bacterium]